MNDITRKAKNAADRAGDASHGDVEQIGQAIQENSGYRWFVTLGLLMYGFVHLVIALIALGIAWGTGDGEATSSGALQEVAAKPFGSIILITCAVGLAALTLWQIIEAAVGNTQHSGSKRLLKRLSSAGRAVLYAVLSFTAIRTVSGSSSGGDQKQESLVATVLEMPGGQILVGLVALAIMAAGLIQIVKGVRKKFEEELDGSVPRWGMCSGQLGYTAKGIAILIVGGLFGLAAFQHNPEEAGDTNSALRTIVEQPFGPYLLSLMALGFAAFAIYCAVWAFNPKHS